MNTQHAKRAGNWPVIFSRPLVRRRGSSLVEALLMIIIVAVVLVGISNSIAASMTLRAHSQIDLDSYMIAKSCFMGLDARSKREFFSGEGVPTALAMHDAIRDQRSLNFALSDDIVKKGGRVVTTNLSANPGVFTLKGINLRASIDISAQNTNGYSKVTLEIKRDGSHTNKPKTFTHSLNVYNSAPVVYTGNSFKQRVR